MDATTAAIDLAKWNQGSEWIFRGSVLEKVRCDLIFLAFPSSAGQDPPYEKLLAAKL
jgi:hypothetical protein